MPAACKQIYKEANNGIKYQSKAKCTIPQFLVGKQVSDPPSTGSATENGTVISSRKLCYDFVHSGQQKTNKRI